MRGRGQRSIAKSKCRGFKMTILRDWILPGKKVNINSEIFRQT
jgi:hypothetical protein